MLIWCLSLLLMVLTLSAADDGNQLILQVATEPELNSATATYQSTIAVAAHITLSHYVQVLERSIVIEGNGYTISGNKSTRCFYLRGSINNTVVTVQNMTIADGYASNSDDLSGYGAAFFVESFKTELHLNDCTITSNSVESSGGAIYVTFAAQATLTRCILSLNRAENAYGGAILVEIAGLDLIDCVFTENTAFYGGVISSDNSEIFVHHTSFTQNAAVIGGAVYFQSSSTFIASALTFAGNVADSGSSNDFGDGSASIRTQHATPAVQWASMATARQWLGLSHAKSTASAPCAQLGGSTTNPTLFPQTRVRRAPLD